MADPTQDPNQVDPRVMERNFAMPEPPAPPIAFQLPPPAKLDDVPVPKMPPLPMWGAQWQDPIGGGGDYDRKPYGFALENGTKGARVYFGTLIESVTRINVQRVAGIADILNVLASQPIIPKTTVHYPRNLSGEFGHQIATELTWFGNVYLYWEVSKNCEVTFCELRGPDKPDEFQVPKLNSDLTRDWGLNDVAKYCVLIGCVNPPSDSDPTSNEVTQYISGDVTWAVTFIPENPKAILTYLPSGTGAGTGSLTIKDCHGVTMFKMDWVNGLITAADSGNAATLLYLPNCAEISTSYSSESFSSSSVIPP